MCSCNSSLKPHINQPMVWRIFAGGGLENPQKKPRLSAGPYSRFDLVVCVFAGFLRDVTLNVFYLWKNGRIHDVIYKLRQVER